MSKHHVTAKAQKIKRRNRQKVGRRLVLAMKVVEEQQMKETSAEELRLRAIKRAKEARDANKLS